MVYWIPLRIKKKLQRLEFSGLVTRWALLGFCLFTPKRKWSEASHRFDLPSHPKTKNGKSLARCVMVYSHVSACKTNRFQGKLLSVPMGRISHQIVMATIWISILWNRFTDLNPGWLTRSLTRFRINPPIVMWMARIKGDFYTIPLIIEQGKNLPIW